MDAPEFFVARDRARRFTRRLRDTLTERRLSYRGADVGMASLVNEAEATLTPLLADIETTIADVDAGRLRDRERGYTEVPLTVAAASVADRIRLAQRVDRTLGLKGVPADEARREVLHLLEQALARLDAFVESYDAKEPVAPPTLLDLGHRLEVLEADAAWMRRLAGAGPGADPGEGPATDRRVPKVMAPPHALDDVLWALRALVPHAAGPWRVDVDDDAGLLTLRLGTALDGDVELPPPSRLATALQVLAFRAPASVRLRGSAGAGTPGLLSAAAAREDTVRAVEIVLTLPAASDGGLDLEACAGPGATLHAKAQGAFEALQRAPVLGPDGTPPPPRLVAWMGLFTALDAEIKRVVMTRAKSNGVRVVAGRLPRESTRRAPLKALVTDTLSRSFEGLAAERVDAIASELAAGKLASSRANAADAATVLALVGRTWEVGGAHLPRTLVLDPLEDREVHALVHDLLTIAASRRDLESGAALDRAHATALERALLGALGRLGRILP